MLARYGYLAALTAAFALAGCASHTSVTTSGPSDCFDGGSVANYAVQDRDTVNLRTGGNAYYQLKLLGVCPQIKWSPAVALRSQGAAQACTGTDVTIVTQTRSGPQECVADSLRRLSSGEIAALPASARP